MTTSGEVVSTLTAGTGHPYPVTLCPAPVTRHHLRESRATACATSTELDVERTLLLNKLFDSSITLMHLRGAVSPAYCTDLVRAAATVPFQAYAKTENSDDYAPILKFGPTAFDYIGQPDKSGYFASGRDAAAAGAAAFAAAGVINPLTLVLNALRRAWPRPVDVAFEGYSAYFAGVMRDIRDGALPHVDHAKVETPELIIGDTIAQVSLLIYASVPTTGGALRVYDKTPTASDYRDHTLGYGFSPEAVRGTTFRGVTPEVGSVVLFPSTQIHSVDAVTGDGQRITWSTFIGLRPDGSLVLWS